MRASRYSLFGIGEAGKAGNRHTCMEASTRQSHPKLLNKADKSREVLARGAKLGAQRIDIGMVVGKDAENKARFRIVILELTKLTFVVESDQ